VPTLESLAHQRFGDLSRAEISVLSNAGIGQLAICGPSDNLNDLANEPGTADRWGADRWVRGELISWLCADRQAKILVDPGGVQVLGAKIVGPVKLLSVPIQFPLVFACCEFGDEINLQSAGTRTLSFIQTHIQSIIADGAIVGGAFFLRHSRAALLQFSGAGIDGQFDCDRSAFNRLILDGAVVGVGVLLRHTTGQVKISRARIGTDLDCDGASFTAPDAFSGPALDASGVNVEGSVFLRAGFRAIGSVQLLGAHIGSNLDCTRGEFLGLSQTSNWSGEALGADAVVVGGTVFLSDEFRARGAVHFTSSQIRGDFNCRRATFETGLTIERADVSGTFFWREVTMGGAAGLDLLNTSVGSLSDDSVSWPSHQHVELHGFVYERISLSSPRSAKERLNWLARQKSFATQPYLQLAKVLRDEGHGGDAQKVLFEMESRRRREEDRGSIAHVVSFVYRNTLGYGYYPTPRAGFCLALLIAVGILLFLGRYLGGSMVPTDKEAYSEYRLNHQLPPYYVRFHVSMYSLENTFPLVKLGQTDRWQPDPYQQGINAVDIKGILRVTRLFISARFLRFYQWTQIICGWFFAAMFVGGLADIVRKN
jgi:hypothetical protein